MSNLEILEQMDMGDITPEERKCRIAAALEALRNGKEVRGVVNGQVVILKGEK
mgnify:CR=1 FL=1